MLRRLAVLAAALGCLVPAALEPAGAQAQTPRESSSNWAGYAATGQRFRKVSASWAVPRLACTPGTATDSAAWVGLGGYAPTSTRIEQLGTEARCTSTGRAVYSAWYELLPAPAVAMPLRVGPGDRMTGSVTLGGPLVTLRLQNRTRGTSFLRVVRAAAVDGSSAEWVVEAPSLCTRTGNCRTTALANFGTTTFTSAIATTAAGRIGGIGDPAWSATPIDLAGADGGSAATGPLAPSGTSFAVAFAGAPQR